MQRLKLQKKPKPASVTELLEQAFALAAPVIGDLALLLESKRGLNKRKISDMQERLSKANEILERVKGV